MITRGRFSIYGARELKKEEESVFPFRSTNTPFITFNADHEIRIANTLTEKRELLSRMYGSAILLAGWPGQYRQDLFFLRKGQAGLGVL